jgi:RimJ/RimL family protein N-acetyltransferase
MINPGPVTLEGHGVRLELLDASHAAALAPGREREYVAAALEGQRAGEMVPWVVRELTTNTIVGSTRYCDIVREIDRLEIGYTFYARRWQRTHVNTTCKLLLLEHAFERMGCQVVGFRVDNLNRTSQTAVEALGARKDGVIRHFERRPDGSARDTHMYSILLAEWPAVRRRLEDRLSRHA